MSGLVANVTGRAVCEWCEDGLAHVASRPTDGSGFPEYGPCPRCEAGARLEFPDGGKTRPVWPDGFWQGRDETVIRPTMQHGKTLPHAENTLRLRLLTRRLDGEQVDPCVGVDFTDPKRRMDLLRQEVGRS